MSVNGLNVLFVNVHPWGVRGLHELSATSLKRLSINVCPRDVRESVDVMPESGIPVINGIGP